MARLKWVAASLLVACHTSPQSESLATSIAATAGEWPLLQPAVFRIGVADEPETHALHQPRSPVIHGHTVTLANSYREVRRFDRSGRYLDRFGRAGGGPGEFGRLWAVTVLPDFRIVTLDLQQGRVQVFDSTGSALHTYRLGASFDPNIAPAFLRDGRVVALATAWPAQTTSNIPVVVRDTVPLLLFDSITGRPDTLAFLAGMPWWMVSHGDRVGAPLSARPAVAAGDGVVAFATGERFELHLIHLATRRRRSISLNREPLAGNSQDVEFWRQEELERWMARDSRVTRDFGTRLLPEGFTLAAPEWLPAYSRLLFDSRGCLWAEHFRRPGSPTVEWDVIDTAVPVMLGRVAISRTFRVGSVHEDLIIGVEADADGVEQVAAYGLRRRAAAREDCQETGGLQ